MDDLHQVADLLTAESTAIGVAAGALPNLCREGAAFGADTPGMVGEVGRALHRQWTTAVYAREREARRVAERVADAAAAVAGAARSYLDVECAVPERFGRGEP